MGIKQATIETAPPSYLRKELHPNRIGFYGAALEAGSFVAETVADTYGVGPVVGKVIGSASDVIDGQVARSYPDHLRTKEGARLDPLLDKVRTYITAMYVLAQTLNPYVAISYLANLGIDVRSTLKRGSIGEQFSEAARAIYDPESCEVDNTKKSSDRANNWGKAKAGLQNIAGVELIGEELVANLLQLGELELNRPVYEGVGATMLLVAAVCGYIGQQKRGK